MIGRRRDGVGERLSMKPRRLGVAAYRSSAFHPPPPLVHVEPDAVVVADDGTRQIGATTVSSALPIGIVLC